MKGIDIYEHSNDVIKIHRNSYANSCGLGFRYECCLWMLSQLCIWCTVQLTVHINEWITLDFFSLEKNVSYHKKNLYVDSCCIIKKNKEAEKSNSGSCFSLSKNLSTPLFTSFPAVEFWLLLLCNPRVDSRLDSRRFERGQGGGAILLSSKIT